MEKKKPQIRFNGFTEDWEKKKLGELGKWYKGQPLSKSDIRECGTFPCIHYGELFSYTEIIREVTSRTNVKPSILSSGNDLLFPDSDVTPDGLGRCSSLTDKGVLLGAGINILQLESCVRAPFCSLCTNVHKEQIIERVTGTTVRHTKPSSLSEVVISISPSIPEQEKIGVFLTTLDKLIAKLEAKLDKLRKLKQALLEKMFINVNGGGYEAPQIRFKGYTDKWQVKKLREVAEFAKGKGYSKGDLTKEGIPIIRYGSLYTDYRTEIDSVSEYVQYSEGAIFSRGGEVIIPASGETSEDIARASAVKLPNVILGGDLNIIYPNAEINAVFLATEITYGKSHTYLAMKAQGASVVHLRKLDIFSLSPKFPSISEQQQIGKYFVQMDVQLSKASIKLTKLRNIKQSLLQKMFA